MRKWVVVLLVSELMFGKVDGRASATPPSPDAAPAVGAIPDGLSLEWQGGCLNWHTPHGWDGSSPSPAMPKPTRPACQNCRSPPHWWPCHQAGRPPHWNLSWWKHRSPRSGRPSGACTTVAGVQRNTTGDVMAARSGKHRTRLASLGKGGATATEPPVTLTLLGTIRGVALGRNRIPSGDSARG